VTAGLQHERAGLDERAELAAGVPVRSPTSRGLLAGALVVVNVPIVVATVRALARGWLPLGDNGILLVRARDVGSSHNPLLGSWTSASLVVGENVNNPGPLYFDALAPWVRLLGPWVGLAVGVMVVNMAASSLAVVAARRLAGAPALVGVTVVVAGLQFAMGSELLFDAWQPNALVLPFTAFLVVAAAVAAGDVVLVPWLLGVGSLVVQTHLSHAVVVGVLSLAAIGACVWQSRRTADRSEMGDVGAVAESDATGRTAWHRPLIWSAVVVALAWCQPVIEQLTGRGDGNLSRIVGSSFGDGVTTIGWERAIRLTTEITVRGPWFVRSAYDEAIPPIGPEAPLHGVANLTTSLAAAAGVAVVLVAGGVWAARRGRRALVAMNAMAGLVLVAGYVALATAPVNVVGVAAHQMRWLWPVAAFVSATALTTLLAMVLDLSAGRRYAPRAVFAAGAVAAAAIAVATLPTHTSQAPGPVDSIEDAERATALVNQLGSLEGRGPVLYDPRGLVFAEPYSGLVYAELQDRGIEFVFDDEVMIRQFGHGRRNDGTPRLRLWQVVGRGAAVVPEGAERVAYVDDGDASVALFVEPLPR